MAELTSKTIVAHAVTVNNKKVCVKGTDPYQVPPADNFLDKALSPIGKALMPQAQSFCTTKSNYLEAAQFGAELVLDMGFAPGDLILVTDKDKNKKAKAEFTPKEVKVTYHEDPPSRNPLKNMKQDIEGLRNAVAQEEKHDLVSVTRLRSK